MSKENWDDYLARLVKQHRHQPEKTKDFGRFSADIKRFLTKVASGLSEEDLAKWVSHAVLDNANNEAGITKLGPTLSTLFSGQQHGELGGALPDTKSEIIDALQKKLKQTEASHQDKYEYDQKEDNMAFFNRDL